MTREGRLRSGRLATWMDGVTNGYFARTAGPSTALRSGRDDNSVIPQELALRSHRDDSSVSPRELQRQYSPRNRFVIPTGAPQERSGGTCGLAIPALPR